MTSIRMPFVSPFPIDCPNCDQNIVEDDVIDRKVQRRKERTLKVQCSNCDKYYNVVQVPLMPEYDIEETSND